MMQTNTNYTATYTADGHIDSTLLQEECKILTGSWAANVEKHSDPDTTNFTISDTLIEGVDVVSHFQYLARDLSRYLKTPVTLAEVILDD